MILSIIVLKSFIKKVITKQLNKTVSPREEFDKELERLSQFPNIPRMLNEKEENKVENLEVFFKEFQNKNLTIDEKMLL